ncbi:bifunctional peptidase and (3S)-lysyl hydroxylase Jmjd7 [Chelonus insularis]|uniref:bifunctional peptidase and (3S)-lysyl hydroxylase Jmjd7 n=1 Tax=Chelonus insularis TaxID=460826 RepID=UPI00158C0D9B|nr:bifunctional peptidase and (3S)-lysyl hydroxylase Jmjd7 [Chelonus insularis]XP_034943233.1 bifunctional peptidase and (3S)-lysyl hydroxylase Jmjd7 [Chelonus insularis]
MENKIEQAFKLLSQEARELYLSEHVAEIDGSKDSIKPLEFYRNYVSRNIPVLIKKGILSWPAIKKWNTEYFRKVLSSKIVNVAVTPNGYADAIASNPEGKEYFTMPEEREMRMTSFLDKLESSRDLNEIFYIQQQNSNFEQYFYELWSDVDKLPWATEAFGKDPDAVNFWMGDERAITSMHKDPYENIYCVISGKKYFTLHPPTDLPWIPYKKYPPANYKKCGDDWIIEPVIHDKTVDLSSNSTDYTTEDLIPWISVDPLTPNYNRYPQYKNVTQLNVTVEAGDILYLPSLWFHHVKQSHACIALNFWYDMDYDIKYAYYKSIEILCQ